MASKKTALIVFPDEWLPYSPSILNSIAVLENNNYRCKTIAFSFNYFKKKNIVKNCTNIHINYTLYKLMSRLKIYNYVKYYILCIVIAFYKISNNKIDLVIGVDNIGFSACKIFYQNTLFFSLEVDLKNFWKKACAKKIETLIVQSKERANYLTENLIAKPKIIYLQNAPISTHILPYSKIDNRQKKLVYWGNVESYYNIEPLIECLNILNKEFTLTLRGIKNEKYHQKLILKYNLLISEKRLLFNYNYIAQENIINELQTYYIGFAMYDFDKLKENNFNFISSPSGKQFNYMAACIPIISQNIIGFKPIKENNTGVLLDNFNSENIANAIYSISKDYTTYCNNAYNASKIYNFENVFMQVIAKD